MKSRGGQLCLSVSFNAHKSEITPQNTNQIKSTFIWKSALPVLRGFLKHHQMHRMSYLHLFLIYNSVYSSPFSSLANVEKSSRYPEQGSFENRRAPLFSGQGFSIGS